MKEAHEDGIHWPSTIKRLVAYGRRRHLSTEDAEELAQEAVLRFFDPSYQRRDPELYPTPILFLVSTFNGLVRNHHKRRGRRYANHDAVVLFTAATTSREKRLAHDPVQELTMHHLAAQAFSLMLDRTRGDPLAQEVLELMRDGHDKPAAMAATLHVPIRNVYEARRRLSRHGRAIATLIQSGNQDDAQAQA